jgi:hypothetical protein
LGVVLCDADFVRTYCERAALAGTAASGAWFWTAELVNATYCTVYVHGAEDCQDLARAVGDILGGTVGDRCIVVAEGVEAQAHDSDEFSPVRATEFPVGFYYFPFLLEVDFAEGATVDTAVESVGRVLRGLWDRGWAAVATSGYADRLPYEGGVSEELPWPGGS